MKTHQALLFMVLIGLLISCSKDDSSKTNRELLTDSPWIHKYDIADANNNSKPDDETGDTQGVKLKFHSDGTLEYTLNGEVQHVTWNFEIDETAIKFIGLEFDSILSMEKEFIRLIYKLDESNLIFQGTTIHHPDQLTFYVYGKKNDQ
jgi:hypothetical protein